MGISMPYSQSDPRSEKHAELLARQLNIGFIKEPLASIADSFFAAIPTEDRIRKGNVLARLRMIILFDWSHKNRHLVLGTSNKTELLLGYGTWYGDTACSLNAIGDLYKTQVRQLASYLKIPQPILDKTPSADLWPGQTDESEIGMSYDEMDGILYRLHDKEMSPLEMQQEGFKSELIQRVADLVQANHFKRLPPEIARLDSPD
jgi:NAD+ synthase